MKITSLGQPAPEPRSARKEYHLLFRDQGGDAAKIVDFNSDDGHEVFMLAERETPGRAGQLWLDDHLLCDLVHNEDGVWNIRPAE